MEIGSTTVDISSNINLWLLLVLIVTALLFSIWTYFHTLPPTRRLIRALLIFLRWSAISGALILLAQPVIELHRKFSEPASIAVLLDQSASMAINQGGTDRHARVNDLLKSGGMSSLSSKYNVQYFGFADSMLNQFSRRDDLVKTLPTGIGTNISRSWMEASEKLALNPAAAMILISDGAHNDGPDPVRMARTARSPVWTIGIGSREAYKDAMLRQVIANPVVYQGSKTPVEIGYRCIGAKGENLTLSVRKSSGELISKQQINVDSDFVEGTAVFELEATESGKRRFQVELSTVKGELTTDNNSKSFYLNVLASRMRVLLMAGSPDYNLGDLVRRFSLDEHIELTQRTTKGQSFYEGDWPSEEMIKQSDVLILHHFPVRVNDAAKLKIFADLVQKAELPVGYFDGDMVDSRKLRLFDAVLPVDIREGRSRLSRGQVIPVHRHSIVADPDEADYTIPWTGLPPLIFYPGRVNQKSQSLVLAEIQSAENERRFPAIVISEKGGQKSAAFLAEDPWRWGMVYAEEDNLYEKLLRRLIRWLAVRKAGKRVEISTDKELFSSQEQIGFTVNVMDENYHPVEDALVRSVISTGDTVGSETVLESIGQGRYRGSFRSWGEGEYSIEASALSDNLEIGKDKSRISVEPFNIELLDARLNEELLRSVSEFSGGEYISYAQSDSFLSGFDIPPEERETTQRIVLWGKGWILAVILLLLSTEWFIRIRSGML